MNHKRRRFAALLGALLLSAFIVTVPALATDGTVPYTDGTGETAEDPNDPTVSFPVDPTPPTPTAEPTPVITPEPPPESSPEPTSEPPVSSDIPSEVPTDPPYQEPTEDPGTNGGGYTEPTQSPTNTPRTTPRPTNAPVELEKPAVERPKVTLNTSSTSSETETPSGPNYKTFAKLNLKNNSMSVTLFYGGIGCIAVGLAGLVTLLVFFLRNRRRDERDGIFQEIQEAENRQHPGSPLPSPLPDAPIHNRPAASAGASQQALPPQQRKTGTNAAAPASPVSAPPAGAAQPARPVAPRQAAPAPRRNGPNAPLVPMEASMYTEEFSIPEEQPVRPAPQRPAQVPAGGAPQQVQRAARQAAPAPRTAPNAPAQQRPAQTPAGGTPQQAQRAARQAAPAPRTAPNAPAQQRPAQAPAGGAPQQAQRAAKQAAPKPRTAPNAPAQQRPAQAPAGGTPQQAQRAAKQAAPKPTGDQLPGQMSLMGEPKPAEKSLYDTDEILQEALRNRENDD